MTQVAVSAPVEAVVLFLAGAVLAVWATERLLDGLVGLAATTSLSTFAVGAVLSGFEAENVAVGLAAGAKSAPEVALGTVFGGAVFLVCVPLGLGAVLYPLRVRLPKPVLITLAVTPLLAGLAIAGDRTPRWAGAVLLASFVGAMTHLVIASRRHALISPTTIAGSMKRPSLAVSLVLTIVGILVVGVGGEMVARGATRMVAVFAISAGLVGMVITPAAIELEEVIRQAVPNRKGHPEVSGGNLVGTLLYFVLFNLGLIALLTPVAVNPRIRTLDWPFLIAVTWLAVLFLARGQVGRREGAFLIAAYAGYVILHAI
ncbi:MAG: sodium:calcium antiporter [Gemmatimonadota bacterium]